MSDKPTLRLEHSPARIFVHAVSLRHLFLRPFVLAVFGSTMSIVLHLLFAEDGLDSQAGRAVGATAIIFAMFGITTMLDSTRVIELSASGLRCIVGQGVGVERAWSKVARVEVCKGRGERDVVVVIRWASRWKLPLVICNRSDRPDDVAQAIQGYVENHACGANFQIYRN